MVKFCRNILLSALLASAWVPAERAYAGSTHSVSQEYKACAAQTNGVTSEMMRCANDELRRQELRLKLVLVKTLARLSGPRKHELESKQKAWETNRNKGCMAEARREAGGGSSASVIALDCAVSKTAERADQLEAGARQ